MRRDVWSLEATEPWDSVTLGYAKAVAEMQARPADDPTSWAYQAAIHGTYTDAPPGAEWNQCQAWASPGYSLSWRTSPETITTSLTISSITPAWRHYPACSSPGSS